MNAELRLSCMKTKGLILAQSGTERQGSPIDRRRTRYTLPVANKPIIHYALGAMAGAGITEVAIAVDEDAEEPIAEVVGSGRPWGLHVSYARTDGTGCVAGALLGAEAFLDGHPFVVQHGDGLLRDDLGALIGALEAEDTGASDALLLVHTADGPQQAVPARDGRPPLRAVTDDPIAAPGDDPIAARGLAMAGAQIFGRGFLHRAADHIRADHPVLDLASLAADLARSPARVSLRRIGGWRRFEGDPSVLLDMNRLILDDLDAGPPPSISGSRVEGRVSIHPSARVRSSVIRGPVVLGPDVSVEDSFIGPFTAISEGARIEGAEVENSIIFPGAVIVHVGTRLESCVIGREARVERRFSVPRAMRLHLSDSTSVVLG
jgi:glucose-1-phosphate thymidylyltransferase